METHLTKACEIIDNLMMRTLLPTKKRLGYREVNSFFKEVGYVPQIDRPTHRRTNSPTPDREEAVDSAL